MAMYLAERKCEELLDATEVEGLQKIVVNSDQILTTPDGETLKIEKVYQLQEVRIHIYHERDPLETSDQPEKLLEMLARNIQTEAQKVKANAFYVSHLRSPYDNITNQDWICLLSLYKLVEPTE